MDHLGNFTLLPAKEGTCPECASTHDPDMPHNQGSLFYQYHFFQENGRWPTWADAMSHCDKDVQDYWKKALANYGINVGDCAEKG